MGVADGSGPAVRAGFWAASLTALLAAVSFGVAVTTPPRTGPFAAAGSALAYPYAAAALRATRFRVDVPRAADG